MPHLGRVVAALAAQYPPAWAEPWDAVGLVVGDPGSRVDSVLFAVDPVGSVIEEAVERGVDLLVAHHPLLLRPVSSVAATTAKGRAVHRLITAGIALHVAHTNADLASPGVSDALADVLGLRDVRPLRPGAAEQLDRLVTYVPTAQAEALIDALAAAGAGRIGDYDRAAFVHEGVGTFRPGPGASPAIGQVGRIERVAESRVEMVLPRARRAAVVAALLAAHPYEEVAYGVTELAEVPGPRGLGRVGELPEPRRLADFVRHAAAALPPTAARLRVAGDPERTVRTVAVCGGAGDSELARAGACGADVFLTADLRHHPASEHLDSGGPALVDAPHWATEWPWLPVAARRLRDELAADGDTVTVAVSEQVTDPWTDTVASPHRPVQERTSSS